MLRKYQVHARYSYFPGTTPSGDIWNAWVSLKYPSGFYKYFRTERYIISILRCPLGDLEITFFCLPACLAVCLYACLSVCLCPSCRSICLSAYLSVSLVQSLKNNNDNIRYITTSYSFTSRSFPTDIRKVCVSACTQKTPNLRCWFFKRRLTNTSRRHRLVDG